MQLFSKFLTCIKILLFFSFFISQNSLSNELTNIQKEDRILGNLEAPITLIEYASLSCPHCADFHKSTLPKIKSEYIDTGKVKLVFRDFPLNLPALQGSMITRCIGEDVYYKYLDALFSLQSSWVRSKNSEEYLFAIIENGGMTRDEFDLCLANKEIENQILTNQIKAQREFKISTTPSFIINGKLIEGNKPIETFKKIFDNILDN